MGLKAVAAVAVAVASVDVGSTALNGGTDKRVLFDDNGVVQEDAGLTFTKATGVLAVTTAKLAALTVATLPTPSAGMAAYVTDGDSSLAWGATVVNSGSGTTKYLVWYNGANWTVAGK